MVPGVAQVRETRYGAPRKTLVVLLRFGTRSSFRSERPYTLEPVLLP